MSRVVVNAETCGGCGACLDACPVDVFRLQDGVSVPVYAEDCHTCFLCLDDCPTSSITVDTVVSLRSRVSIYDETDIAEVYKQGEASSR